MGTRRLRNWWSLGAVPGIAAVVAWLLYLIWRSPHRDDWATFGAFALPVAAVVTGWLAWAWRKGKASQLTRLEAAISIMSPISWQLPCTRNGKRRQKSGD